MAVPWACCSAPRAVSTMARSAPASSSASARSSATGTPETRSTRSGHQAATARRTSSQPVVRAATYSSSTAPAASSRCSSAERERQVGAGHRLEEQVGAVGGRRAPRVDHDHLAAALAQPVEVPGRRRHRLGEVGADEHHHVGLLDVGERERQPAVDPERPVAGRGGRRHAPAAVVVDLAGAERDPGELAELVGLLVGEPAAAEHRDAVRSALPAQLEQPGRDQVERLVPRSRAQLTRACGRAAAGWSAARGGRAARRPSTPCGTARPR